MSAAGLCRSRTTLSVDRPDVLQALINANRPASCNVFTRLQQNKSVCTLNHNNFNGNANNSNAGGSQHSSLSGLVDDNELVNSTTFDNWLCADSIHKVQTESDPDCRMTSQMCESILGAEHQYAEEVSDFLCDQDMLDLRRRELLHRKWSDRVYNPIRGQIDTEIHGKNFSTLRLHKRQLFNEFLEHCNRSGQIFLTSSGETRGANFKLKPLKLTAQTRLLDDPLLVPLRTLNAEDGIGARCDTGKRLSRAEADRLRLPTGRLNPPGRHQMTWEDWQIMHINQIESPIRQRGRVKMHPNKTTSLVTWAHYYKPLDREVLDEEMSLMKREQYRRPRLPTPPPPQQPYTASAL